MKLKVLTGAVLLTFAINSAYADTPLLMEGKSSIYQRVLTTPSCRLKAKSDDKDGKVVDAFSRFYVYADDGKTLKVGPDDTGKLSGYLNKDCTIDWKMQTALMFTNPANRNRALIFKNKENLQNIVEAKDPKALFEPMMKKVAAKENVDGVVSVEPEHFVDYQKQFYLLPILDFEETMFDDGNYVRELKIASVTKQEGKKVNVSNEQNALKTFKAAVVFVIDSSISMQPYIDRTKETISAITKTIK